ncbi:MAG: hypothetical protein ACFFAS_07240 [Promethearchaeota archaeon]
MDVEKINDTNKVVYLEHDDFYLHGMILGNNFEDFVSKWSDIGCPKL